MNYDPIEQRVKVWEKTIDVQQHFNDIGLRIRNLFVTLLAGIVAILGYAIKTSSSPPTGTSMSELLAPYAIPIASAGVVVCAAFWFLDRLWYHRLLRGAVKMGEELEQGLTLALGGDVGLTKRISDESRFKFGSFQVDATLRLDFFYGVFALLLIVFAEIVRGSTFRTYGITGAVALIGAFAVSILAQLRKSGRGAPAAETATPPGAGSGIPPPAETTAPPATGSRPGGAPPV